MVDIEHLIFMRDTLKELSDQYGGRTLDNVIQDINSKLKYYGK